MSDHIRVQPHYLVKPCYLCKREVVTCPDKRGQYVKVEYKGMKYNAAEDVFTGREHLCPVMQKETNKREKPKSDSTIRDRNGRFQGRARNGDDPGGGAGEREVPGEGAGERRAG